MLIKKLHSELVKAHDLKSVYQYIERRTSGFDSWEEVIRLLYETFMADSPMFQIRDEKVFLYRRFYVPLNSLNSAQLRILLRAILECEVKFYKSDAAEIVSVPVKMDSDSDSRWRSFKMAIRAFSDMTFAAVREYCEYHERPSSMAYLILEKLAHQRNVAYKMIIHNRVYPPLEIEYYYYAK